MIYCVRKIKPPETFKAEYPVTEELQSARKNAVSQIRNILSGKDKRKLFVVGPCSADDPDAVCDYAVKLARIAKKVKDRLFVIVRAHTAKPRTRSDEYMGLIHTPDVKACAVTDIAGGLCAMRKLHVRILRESGLPTADELLYPEVLPYIDDCVSYLFVGARTCDDPLHRFAASGAEVPVGIKNPLNGNIEDLFYSVLSAKSRNEFYYRGEQARSNGNEYAHAVLRGYVDADGRHVGNYGKECVMRYKTLCDNFGEDCSLLIDAGHSNSGKNALKQRDTIAAALDCMRDKAYADAVKGFIVESYIEGGVGVPGKSKYGQSVTDECLDFERTERLILSVAEKLTAS